MYLAQVGLFVAAEGFYLSVFDRLVGLIHSHSQTQVRSQSHWRTPESSSPSQSHNPGYTGNPVSPKGRCFFITKDLLRRLANAVAEPDKTTLVVYDEFLQGMDNDFLSAVLCALVLELARPTRAGRQTN